MKNLVRFCILLVSLPLWMACSKNLDYNEATFYDEEAVLRTPGLYKGLLTALYAYLPTDFNVIDDAMRASASDDAVHVWDLSQIKRFNDGTWSALQTVDAQWDHYYTAIRSANKFLELSNGPVFDDLKYNDDYPQLLAQIKYYPSEARFLRAFFYFELLKRYGAVPLVTKLLTQEEANSVERTPYQTVVDFIVSECDAAAVQLPANYNDVPMVETGRITSAAAMALKGRTLLYAASPLHNPTNDVQKWVKAAQASKDIIDLARYRLNGQYTAAYNNLGARELILETRENFSNRFESLNTAIGFEGGNTSTCPTQNLVDAYEMASTGLGINEPGAGFDPVNPYVGRDSRFYHTILYNGALWKNTPIEAWAGGRNGPPQERASKTGYYLKKYMIESVSLNPVNPTSQIHTWVIFRYAEILLNYAEAMNEAYGPEATGVGTLNMTARDAVNLIRRRATMPNFPTGMSKEDFRKKLRNERRVELAFEDSRFWDIRRWKIGEETKQIYGVDVIRDGNGQIFYQRKLVENRVWNDRMLLYPIPQQEVYINDNLIQNPNW